MHTLYYFSVLLHVLAAITWIGGMAFLVLVAVPYLRRSGDRRAAAAFLAAAGPRFRDVGWACFAVALVTGTFNLWVRGVRLSSFGDPEWLATSFAQTVILKLGVFVIVLAVSIAHDFVVGPRATVAVQKDPSSPEAEKLRRIASWMGRLNALLALALVAAAVALVRGGPF